MGRLKGKATVEIVWNIEIPEDSQRKSSDEFREVIKNAVKESLMDEVMATDVLVKSLEIDVVEDNNE